MILWWVQIVTRVYLSLGTNINREFHITACLDYLYQAFGSLVMSSVYESESVGFFGDPFYNMVVGIDTDLSPGELSRDLKMLEDLHGRDRQGPRFSSRTLDVDILTYSDLCGDYEGLGVSDRIKLPRDEITKNAFVLKPLAEIAPDTKHPKLAVPYSQLWAEYDRTQQKLRPVDFVWQRQSISSSDASVY